MRITVTRTGGFAGLRLERSVDTAERPDARELEELVASAQLDALPETPPQPDRFTYRIDVDGREVTVAEPDLTGPMHTLVERVLHEEQ
jgi:hypothetical protein